MDLPDDFRCPISLELMTDPVILSSGHTFDRSSIQRWLDAGHLTCPITKLPLPHPPILIPNHALRSLISNYTPDCSIKPQPCHSDTQALISLLATLPGKALDGLIRASKHDSATRRRLAESGAVSAVLRCVAEAELREKALNLLLNLSLDDDNKVGLVAEGVIGHVIGVLRGPAQDGARAVGATILTSLSVVEVNKATIGAYPFAIVSLISLVNSGNSREKKEAATALFTLCSYPENRKRSVEFGGVRVLINAANLGLERAIEVLGLLAKCKEGRVEMARFGNLISILVNYLKNGSQRGVQYALLTMALLCVYSESLCVEAVGEGAFEHCVGLLEDENEKIRRNALNLLQILRGKRSMG